MTLFYSNNFINFSPFWESVWKSSFLGNIYVGWVVDYDQRNILVKYVLILCLVFNLWHIYDVIFSISLYPSLSPVWATILDFYKYCLSLLTLLTVIRETFLCPLWPRYFGDWSHELILLRRFVCYSVSHSIHSCDFFWPFPKTALRIVPTFCMSLEDNSVHCLSWMVFWKIVGD